MDPENVSSANNRYRCAFYSSIIACLALLLMNPVNSNELTTEPTWSKTESGIRIGLAIEDLVSDSINLRLCFSNTNNTRQRIYFIDNAFFRSFQSYFMAKDTIGETILLTPPSPPHGYVVGAKDFPLLEPETTLCFDETLQLADNETISMTHLTWIYRNEIPRWQGGVSTFDGETQYLFDDDQNPELWVGERQVEVRLVE